MPMPLPFAITLDGLEWMGTREKSGIFRPATVLCPTCHAPLEILVLESGAHLVCTSGRAECIAPAKTFADEVELRAYLDCYWKAVGDACLRRERF